jgi:hypothetical protein
MRHMTKYSSESIDSKLLSISNIKTIYLNFLVVLSARI